MGGIWNRGRQVHEVEGASLCWKKEPPSMLPANACLIGMTRHSIERSLDGNGKK